MTPQELKNSILQLAIQGKLVEQRPEEGTAEELYQQIKHSKQLLEIVEDDLPFDIPESWCWGKLQHFANINGGYAFKSTNYMSNGVRVVRISDFNEDGFVNDKIVRHAYDDTLSPFLVEKNNILLCMTGGTVGKSLFVKRLEEKMMVNQRVAKIKINDILPEYAYIVILAPLTKAVIHHSKNSTNDNISMETINNFSIPLPPLAEQKRIVAKIEELLPYIDRYEHAWSKLEDFNKRFPADMQKSILQMAIQGKLVEQRPEEGTGEDLLPLCRDDKERSIKEGKYKKETFRGAISNNDCIPFEIPNSWIWMYISDMSLFQEGPGIMAVDFRSAGVPLIRIAGMQADIVSLEGCNYLDEDMVAAKWAHFRLDFGDIVISTSASTDKIAEVNEECVGSIPYTGLIRFKMYGGIDKNFFKWFIKSPCYIKQVDEQKAGGTIKHYGPSHLKKMVIPLPPLAEQKRIVAKLEEILPLCEKLKK